jgi:hypothetical protein
VTRAIRPRFIRETRLALFFPHRQAQVVVIALSMLMLPGWHLLGGLRYLKSASFGDHEDR